MKPVIKLTNATLITIKSDTDRKDDQVLYATVVGESESGAEGEVLFTSKVMKVDGLEYRTFGGEFYLLDAPPKAFEASVSEFNFMHECMLSPIELVELKDMYQPR